MCGATLFSVFGGPLVHGVFAAGGTAKQVEQLDQRVDKVELPSEGDHEAIVRMDEHIGTMAKQLKALTKHFLGEPE